MDALPVSVSVYGAPARFAQVQHGLGFSLTHTVTGPTNGPTYVIEGIDVSCGPTGVEVAAWYDIDGGAQVYFWSSTIDITSPRIAYVGDWRGAIPIGNGDTITFGIDASVPCAMAIIAWGVVMPYPFGGGH